MPGVQVMQVPLSRLRLNPDNPASRHRGIEELAASMKAVGVLQPLGITPAGAGLFLVVDGWRRYNAAELAGLQTVPCVPWRAATRRDRITLTLAAGLGQRLTPMEEAQLMGELRADGMPVVEIAQVTGRHLSTVRDRLLLLTLPTDAQDLVRTGALTATAAVDLARQTTQAGTGTATVRPAARPRWFGPTHPLAADVRARCTQLHRDTRRLLGAVGCEQCWQDAITDNARKEIHA